jgi:DNA-binding Lrp family transcriptional regulator
MIEKEQKIQVLELLYRNSSIKLKDMNPKIGLSRQTISKIKQDLWSRNIIESPALILNPYISEIQTFFMEIKTNPSEPRILQEVKKTSEIETIDGILGDYSLIIRLDVRNKKHFSNILDGIDKNIALSKFQSYRIIETIDTYKIGGFIPTKSENSAKITEKRWDLIQLLKKNYNIAKWPERYENEFFSESEKERIKTLNLSRELLKMENEGIVLANSIKLKKALADFSTKFYIRIKPKEISEYTDLLTKLAKNPNIIDLFRTGEDFGIMAVVRTAGLDGYKIFIYGLYEKHNIVDTHTTVVLDEQIASTFPPTINIAERIIQKKS